SRRIETEAPAIRYVTKIVGADADSERAARWLILMMVVCCDPLAIARSVRSPLGARGVAAEKCTSLTRRPCFPSAGTSASSSANENLESTPLAEDGGRSRLVRCHHLSTSPISLLRASRFRVAQNPRAKS